MNTLKQLKLDMDKAKDVYTKAQNKYVKLRDAADFQESLQ